MHYSPLVLLEIQSLQEGQEVPQDQRHQEDLVRPVCITMFDNHCGYLKGRFLVCYH